MTSDRNSMRTGAKIYPSCVSNGSTFGVLLISQRFRHATRIMIRIALIKMRANRQRGALSSADGHTNACRNSIQIDCKRLLQGWAYNCPFSQLFVQNF